MMNRQHGRMILESVENGPLIWPTIEENGVTRLRKYFELTHAEAIIVMSRQQTSFFKSQQYSVNPSSTPLSITYPSNDYQSLVHLNVYSPQPSIPQLEYAPTVNQQSQQLKFPLLDSGASGSNSMKQKTVICYNCKGEGHMSKQCTKPKRKRDDAWFKDKVLLVQAQVNGQILHEEELAFLADLGITEDVLAEEHNPDNIGNNMINQSVQVMLSSEQSSVKAQQLEPKLYDGNVIKSTSAIVIPDSEETLMLAEESHSKMILKQQDPMVLEKKVNTTPNSMNSSYPSPSCRPTKVEVPKELPKVSMEKGLIIAALRDDLKKLKGKALVGNVVTTHTVTLKMLKIDMEPLAPRLLNNRTAHSHYLRLTREQATILEEIVEQEKSQNPLNNSLDLLHSKLNTNSELICVKCNGCMLSDNHDLCIFNVINDVNARPKSKSIKKTPKRKVWKTIGKVFTKLYTLGDLLVGPSL
nr:hypothetical protein [Tanacetum cinerariifolium]